MTEPLQKRNKGTAKRKNGVQSLIRFRFFNTVHMGTNGLHTVQARIMYYWFKQVKDGPNSEMGGFTRILHSGKPDSFMDEIPTFVAQPLPAGTDQFIFDAAAKFCVDIATHQHGCCVLNRCIDKSVGKYQEKLVAAIAAYGLLLAQDAFGNYVVQYVIQEIPLATAGLISQFEGHYVHLSMQKFSSHVVEKCLKHFEESRPRIIHELLSVPHFEQLLQDPFANYAIQSALEVSKGTLHASLVHAVRPHSILRTSPYCKKIFSRNLLKK